MVVKTFHCGTMIRLAMAGRANVVRSARLALRHKLGGREWQRFK